MRTNVTYSYTQATDDTFKDLGMKDLSTFDPLRPPLNQWMSAGDLLTRIFVRVLKPDIAVV